jgi:hypothetical protein
MVGEENMRSKTGFGFRSFAVSAVLLTGLMISSVRGQALNPNPPASTVKLIFIHHSTGEGWLSDSLGQLGLSLTANNYFVSDTNYGWGPDVIGDRTDIGNWYDWFLGPSASTYCTALFNESGNNSGYSRMADDPGGENEIIMFKSCFPNSAITGNPGDAPLPKGDPNPIYSQSAGDSSYTVANVKGLYRDLLDYFAAKPDKLFILIASPPLTAASTNASEAANARAVADWLVTSWLSSYSQPNVKVFDYFNVLTSNGGSRTVNDVGKANGNHHRYWNGAIQHIQTVSSNYAAYGSSATDSHPTGAGQKKATAEFVPLLNIWYNAWKNVPPSTLTITSPVSGDTWYTRSPVTITWVKSGGQNANVKIQLFRGATKVLDISKGTPNDESFDWTVFPTLAASANYRVRVSTLDGQVQDDSEVFTIARPSIFVTAPAAGAVWNKGTTHSITWVKAGPQAATVKVQLLRSGTKVLDIDLAAPNSESYDWTVPSSLPNSSAYKVRIRTQDNALTGMSPSFSIR